tara:strand:- start:4590 stop:4829 length:240 start_codon:yes stop_codon:yes gene_type:complete
MPAKKTKKTATTGVTPAEVRSLVHEVLNFQCDTVDQVLANCVAKENNPLDRASAIAVSEVLRSALRDAAFSVLASKKFN